MKGALNILAHAETNHPFSHPSLIRFFISHTFGSPHSLTHHADVLVREALLDEGSIISGQVDAGLAVFGGIAGVAGQIVHLLGRCRGFVYGVGQILGSAWNNN